MLTFSLSSSSKSKIANNLSLADIPFIAMWKNEPKILSGMKNSDEIIIMKNACPTFILPAVSSISENITPSAAPM